MDPTTTYAFIKHSFPRRIVLRRCTRQFQTHTNSAHKHTKEGGGVKERESSWDQWTLMHISRSLCGTQAALRRGLPVCMQGTGSIMSEQLCQWCIWCGWCEGRSALYCLVIQGQTVRFKHRRYLHKRGTDLTVTFCLAGISINIGNMDLKYKK